MGFDAAYDIDYFHEHGFRRRRCVTCGSSFWSQDASRVVCGDAPCVSYGFIGEAPAPRRYDMNGMREAFLGFLEERGHARVKPYPVMARWREDIYLTIASIADFQPHVTAGLVPPPANPLAISQPCIRLNDLDSVGRSGRHLSQFEMMAHHVFNYPKGHAFHDPDAKLYFRSGTVDVCHTFLTDRLGIPAESVSYKEKPWAGGGNAGPAFEVLTHGLEVATLVFMQWQVDPEGPIELYGDRYRDMPMKIVDTGYGLERLVWITQGTPTIYHAVFPKVMERLQQDAHLALDRRWEPILAHHARLAALMSVDTGAKVRALRETVVRELAKEGHTVTVEELEERLRPFEDLAAVADHTRCVSHMLADGIVPSNVKAGYLARLLIRRTLRLMERLGLDLPLSDIVLLHAADLRDTFPQIDRMRSYISEVLQLETERFRETVSRGRRGVERELQRTGRVTVDTLVTFYDSHGLPPDVVAEVAQGLRMPVEVPDDFYQRVAARHSRAQADTAAAPPILIKTDLAPTKLAFYDDQEKLTFEARVRWSADRHVVLDQTYFYPEGGGQPHDTGVLEELDAEGEPVATHHVVDVQKVGEVAVHVLEKPAGIAQGRTVRGLVDPQRRWALMRQHTATHLVGGALRHLLGPHVWQAGAQKGVERSRLDFTHHKGLTAEDLQRIELECNEAVLRGDRVEARFMERAEADQRYGFILYQGGVPAGKDIRVVRIGDYDVQACAGTHVKRTTEVGPVRIHKAERIQDGIVRIEFSAGLAAVRAIQQQEALLHQASEILAVPPEQVPAAAQKFFNEWKQLQKDLERAKQALAFMRARELLQTAQRFGERRLVVQMLDETFDPNSLALQLTKEPGTVAVLGVAAPKTAIVVGAHTDTNVDAREVAKAGAAILGGGAGGTRELARGGGPNADALGAALQAAAKHAEAQLRGR